MIINPPKVINLVQLESELAAAGIAVSSLGAVLESDGKTTGLHTYDAIGEFIELPRGSATVVANHVAAPTDQQKAANTLLTDLAYDLKSRQAFAVILGILPGDARYPTA